MGSRRRVTTNRRECAYDSRMVARGSSGEGFTLSRRSLEAALFVVLPVVVLLPVLVQAYRQGILGIDLEQTLRPAARAIARGDSRIPRTGRSSSISAMSPLAGGPQARVRSVARYRSDSRWDCRPSRDRRHLDIPWVRQTTRGAARDPRCHSGRLYISPARPDRDSLHRLSCV